MMAPLPTLLGALSLLGLQIAVELPRDLPAPGDTLFARGRIDPPTGPASAEALWLGQRIALTIEEGGGIPIVLAVPLDSSGPLTLSVSARSGAGDSARSEIEVRLAPRVPPPSETWELDESPVDRSHTDHAGSERAELAAALKLAETPVRLSRGGFDAPVTAPRFGRFGADRTIEGHEQGGEEAPVHRGVDYALRKGASVRPPAAGVVVAIPTLPLLGETVVVSHGQGIASVFGHLESALVEPGDAVTRDSVLGWAGRSGLSNGLMLHYALFVHGQPVNPASWERPPAWLRNEPRPALASDSNTSLGEPSASLVQALPTPTPSTPEPLPPAATAAQTPSLPRPTPVPATTPPVPEEILGEQLAELARAGIESRLPGVKVEVATTAAATRAALDISVMLVELGQMPFITAVETVAFVIGELTMRGRLKTDRLTIQATGTGQRVVLLTRDARQLWRERTGLATPVPREDEH